MRKIELPEADTDIILTMDEDGKARMMLMNSYSSLVLNVNPEELLRIGGELISFYWRTKENERTGSQS